MGGACLSSPTIHVGSDAADTCTLLVSWLEDATQQHTHDRGQASWALSGGNTPIPLYRQLGQSEGRIRWDAVSLYLVDERDVYAQDPLSNFRMMQATLLNGMKTPPREIAAWPTTGDPKEALAWYCRALARLPRHNGYPVLDIVLLGMGDDGHTASVFPGSPQRHADGWVAYGPGPKAHRFTLTLPTIVQARQIVFLVTGQDKAARVRECVQTTDAALPAAWVSRHGLDVHWFLDRDSACEL